MKHVDDWLDEPPRDEDERLAKEWLEHFRRPAVQKDYHWLMARIVTCTYEGSRWRCCGASTMGDIWLTKSHARDAHYDLRVDVEECTDWKAGPR
jgi:hypothetical protein